MNKKMTAIDALKILENTHDKDFYTTEYQEALGIARELLRKNANPAAHWIFSGDNEDYDGYYINCSECGTQRKAYDRDCDLDVPAACPYCAVKMDLNKWEVQDYIASNDAHSPLHKVLVIHDEVNGKRRYTIRLRANNEEEVKEKALNEVAKKWLHWDEIYPSLYVESVEVDK